MHRSPARDAPILASSTRFVREHWLKLAGISLLLLVPCFWHHEIVATDLGSHLYNAWLVLMVHGGRLPGLWIAPQHTNVLFDLMLSNLGSIFGFRAAEKIAVSFAVLIFFWGTFALISAAVRRPPWFLLPCIALVTYGWTFHMGFFNYYLSLGLSFFGLAIWWRGKGWERLSLLAIAPIVFVAHPLGFMWLLGAAVYVGIARMLPRRNYEWLLLIASAASLFAVRSYIWRHYNADPAAKPFYTFTGADQLFLFGQRYHFLGWTLFVAAFICLATDLIRRRHESELWKYYSVPIQLYVLAMFSVVLLPDAIHLPPPTAAIALLTERLTTISAVLGCCVLAAMLPRKWHFVGGAAIGIVFFTFLYQDTAVANRMESQIVELVSKLPPNQRVMGTIEPLPGSRIPIQHIVDRACIERCFSYGNYEPGAGVFRVRASPGNPYVLSSYESATDMESGDYLVQPQDLPVYEVYQCGGNGTEICIRPLKAGEYNGEPSDE
jgi:hypothetical protein